MSTKAYAIFHLNLSYSSISTEARPEVVRHCYWPLLEMAEATSVPLGIEVSGWTLERLQEIDPGWVLRFRAMLDQGKCELIGSGYIQLIGPLVPFRVNRWNQNLGLECYARILSARPKIALVNEMAFSSGLVDLYADAGYQALVMDRDNVRLALGIGHHPIADAPTHGIGPGGASLPLLWADSILFQRLQHYVHGDIRRADYFDYIRRRIATGDGLLPIYTNDAEVFDFRPGRFQAESPTHPHGEWARFADLLRSLRSEMGIEWCSPSEALEHASRSPARPAVLASASQPIPVKKQAKYNLARWAVSGRDSTWLNSMCHRFARQLADEPSQVENWRTLCRLWSSDLRTHITEARWKQAQEEVAQFAERLGMDTTFGGPRPFHAMAGAPETFEIVRDEENISLSIRTACLHLVLNLRRGLNIASLAFRSHEFRNSIGTLPHGFFTEIGLGADFYSGTTVIELPCENSRITDLERVEPELSWTRERLQLRVTIPTRLGPIVKTMILHADAEAVELEIAFPGWSKPKGVIHAGTMTLLPDAFSHALAIRCANGGGEHESFLLDRSFDHTAPSATMVSCSTGLGATDGELEIGDSIHALLLSWNPAQCAVLPMVSHRQVLPSPLTRVYFSLQEFDDTLRPGGLPGTFTLRIAPAPRRSGGQPPTSSTR
jgi:hypothetical protein